jgi:alginate O-acetyltransferase complex protein AlgJ
MMKNFEGKKLFWKIGLFSLPFILCFAVELFILPIDYFTLRPWESLVVQNVQVMDGPFYPNQKVHQIVAGEIAPHSPYAVFKPEDWVTDKYGYRNRNVKESPEVVLIGDSFVAGSGLTQDNILSEALERRINKEVYSYAPAHPGFLTTFLLDKRFKKAPPKTVVFSRAERWLLDLPAVNESSLKEKLRAYIGTFTNKNPALAQLVVTFDRIEKWPMYRYFRAKLDRLFIQKEYNLHQGELFLYGESVNKEVPEAEIQRLSNIIEEYANVVRARGMRFIFMPAPNKESIYYQLLPSQKQANFLPRLLEELDGRGVEVVNLQQPFINSYYHQGILLFPKDDNHWNKNGVNIAADLLYDKIRYPNRENFAVEHQSTQRVIKQAN